MDRWMDDWVIRVLLAARKRLRNTNFQAFAASGNVRMERNYFHWFAPMRMTYENVDRRLFAVVFTLHDHGLPVFSLRP